MLFEVVLEIEMLQDWFRCVNGHSFQHLSDACRSDQLGCFCPVIFTINLIQFAISQSGLYLNTVQFINSLLLATVLQFSEQPSELWLVFVLRYQLNLPPLLRLANILHSSDSQGTNLLK